MAVTIQQQPTSPRYSIGDIVYTVSSNLVGPTIPVANLPRQYSFVVDIYKGSDRIARFFPQPNPVGVATVNLWRTINDNLSYDINALGSTTDTLAANSSSEFTVRFGERYLNSSGVLTIYTGVDDTTTGNPNVSGNSLFVVKGVSESNGVTLTQADQLGSVLSFDGVRTLRVHRDDYVSVSTYATSPTNVISHEVVTIPSTGDTYTETIGGEQFTFNIYDDRSILGETRFAWFNRNGGIDYWTADRGQNSSVSVNKSTYQSTNITFGTSVPSIMNNNAYNASEVVYAVDFDETHNATFNWTSQAESALLEGLFASPRVFVVDNSGNFVPIIVTSNYDRFRIERNQGNFNYTVSYRYANRMRSV